MPKKEMEVCWVLPNEIKPFAESTVGTSNLLVALSEIHQTTKEVYNAINYDDEAKAIVKHFMDKGYSNYIFSDFVHINPSLKYRKIENGKIEYIDLKNLTNHLDINIDNDDYDYNY